MAFGTSSADRSVSTMVDMSHKNLLKDTKRPNWRTADKSKCTVLEIFFHIV